MAQSAVEKFFDLAKIKGHVEEADLAAVYDQLGSVAPEQMIGKWKGLSFDTGHPTHKLLSDFSWAGKDFRSVDDVDPIMFNDEKGNRVWFEQYGHAQLREVKYRGVVSTAMIYDKHPIIDSFRYVAKDIVFGAMDNKDLRDVGTYYFYLTKIE